MSPGTLSDGGSLSQPEQKKRRGRRKPVQEYEYHNAKGVVVAIKTRWEPKGFTWPSGVDLKTTPLYCMSSKHFGQRTLFAKRRFEFLPRRPSRPGTPSFVSAS